MLNKINSYFSFKSLKTKINASSLFNKLFNKLNISKVFIIFIVGLLSRIFVNHIYNVNAHLDCLNPLSLIYYVLFSLFTVLCHELLNYYDINLLTPFLSLLKHLLELKKTLVYFMLEGIRYLNKIILSIKITNNYTLSSVIKNINMYLKNHKGLTRFIVGSYYNLGITKNILENNSRSDDTTGKGILANSYNDNTSRRAHNSNRDSSARRADSHRDSSGHIANSHSRNSTARSGNIPIVYSENLVNFSYSDRNNMQSRTNRISGDNAPLYYENKSVRKSLPLRKMKGSDDLYFKVNTIRSRDTLASRHLYTPESEVSYSKHYPTQTTAKGKSYLPTLATPDISSISERDMFGSYPHSRRTSYNDTSTQNSYFDYYTSEVPHQQYTHTNIPLNNPVIRYGANNVNLTYPNNPSIERTSYGSEYVDPYYSTNVQNNEDYSPTYGYHYVVPGDAPYFNPTRSTINSNQATVGLNGSNEGTLWHQGRSDRNTTNWESHRNVARRNMVNVYRENTQILSEKEVFTPSNNIYFPNEIELKKKGVYGKIKLAFNFVDTKLNKTLSNVDSIAIKYHDAAKRKFFWTVWEKKSGNYLSYEDFKNSWDPNTKIWSQISKRTNKDIQADIEDLLGLRGAKNNKISYDTNRTITNRAEAKSRSNYSRGVRNKTLELAVDNKSSKEVKHNRSRNVKTIEEVNSNCVDNSNVNTSSHKKPSHRNKSSHDNSDQHHSSRHQSSRHQSSRHHSDRHKSSHDHSNRDYSKNKR